MTEYPYVEREGDCNTHHSGYMLAVMIDVVAGVAVGRCKMPRLVAQHSARITNLNLSDA